MKILAITQARYGSTRLPAKILKKVNEMTLFEIHLRRILRAKKISKLKIATTDEEGAKYITDIADKLGVEYYKGSVNDVLERFYGAAQSEEPDYVVRFTSDCPLNDPEVIDMVIDFALNHPEYDYVTLDHDSFPDGICAEVFKYSALLKAHTEACLKSEREHVTPYIWKNASAEGGSLFNSFKIANPKGNFSAQDFRITIDEPEDYEVIKCLIEKLGIYSSWLEYIEYLLKHKELYEVNRKFSFNEGYEKSLKNDKIL